MARADNQNVWNFSVNLWDVTFITLGFSLVSRETVIPVLVSQLTDSKLAIGLVPAMWSLGIYLPQLLTASLAERMVYKKPFIMYLSLVVERLPYLLVGLAVLAFAATAPTVALIALLLGIAVASTGAGVAIPAWMDMVAKVIPTRRRGIWLGLGHGLGLMLGVLGAWFVGRVLVGYPFPGNYARLFFAGFGIMLISWVGLALTREPPSETTKEAIPLFRYLRGVGSVLKQDHNFRRYLISKSLVNLGGMSAGFFAVYGTELFALDGRGVGLLTAVLVGTQAVLNPLWGMLADRVGHKSVLTATALFIVLAPLSALLLHGAGPEDAPGGAPAAAGIPFWGGVPLGLLLVFVFLGAYLASDHTSSLNIILEFSTPESRPTYVGLTNTLLAPVLICAPIFGGWFAGALGYAAMFRVSLAFAVVALCLMVLWVKEPRRTDPRRLDAERPLSVASGT
ncbi:MAG: MFS transporter [Caldilineaceae bacterium]|nr:MFS transporter [Caldilineaceae bacterium]